MSLLLLLRNHQSDSAPPSPTELPVSGLPPLLQRRRLHRVHGLITTRSTLTATGEITFDASADDDDAVL